MRAKRATFIWIIVPKTLDKKWKHFYCEIIRLFIVIFKLFFFGYCKVCWSFLLSIYRSSLYQEFFIYLFSRGKGNLQLDLVNANVSSMRGEVKKKDHNSVSRKKKFQTKKPRDLASNAKKELIWHISEKKLFFNVGRWRRWQRLMIRCLPRKVATVICESVENY